MTVAASPPPRPHGAGRSGRGRPLADAGGRSSTFGHLAWLAWTWVVASVAYAIVIVGVARWGTVDQSLWQSVAAGWQRYVVFGAGVTTTTTFLRMLVRNGVDAARCCRSASTVTMAIIGIVAGLWITAGYAIEKADLRPLRLGPGDSTATPCSNGRTCGGSALETPLVLAAYFVSGWLVGAGFYRFGVAGGLALLLPAVYRRRSASC